jgi:EAL domain-containing protein (putative c-di-GMP-specific phosphodiesterase class I)
VKTRAEDVTRGHARPGGEPSIADIVQRRLVRTVLQPIVSLESGELAAAEALSRGPRGTALENPLAMLAAAESDGLLAELDEAFRETALETAAGLGWPATVSLFVNAEPRTLTLRSLDSLAVAWRRGIDVTVELTERYVSHDVATLLEAGEVIRLQGARVALDDVGADPASLALMALLRPDVVKLDMGIIRNYAAGDMSEIANAVRAYAEESGATVVAEGIENDVDLQVARVLGAHVGQGWHFGRPVAGLPAGIAAGHSIPRAAAMPATMAGDTPYSIVSRHRTPLISTKRFLLPLSHTLEQRGLEMILPPLLLSTFQHDRHFTPETRRRYAELGRRLPFVCALGAGMSSHPASDVRGAALDDADPLVGEWTVVVLGAHFAGALIARDLGDSGPDLDRRFSYIVTHNRELVVAAARSMVGRVVV